MSRNTNNSKNRALNNNIAENNGRNTASEDAGVTDTLPQPAPNIQETAGTDEGHVSRREFNDFRDEMRNTLTANSNKLDEAITAMTNAVAQMTSQQAQLTRSNDDLARRVDALSDDHNRLRAGVTVFMNNPTVGMLPI